MVTECPICQEAVTFEVGQIGDNSEVVCASCLTTLNQKIVLEPVATESDTLAISSENDTPTEEIEALIEQVPFEEGDSESQGPTKKVLLCLEGEATRELVEVLLESENIHLIDIPSEMEALVSADCPSPDIALIDLDLNRNFEIDLCAEIRQNPVFKDSAIIVIGSMFEKNTGYRDQEPVFPGADDFIDRYSLQKELIDKIMNSSVPITDEVPSEQNEVDLVVVPEYDSEPEVDDLEAAENADVPEVSEEDVCEDAHENAQRVARDIISDMISCNEEKFKEGIRSGEFYDFLIDEIGESRSQYEAEVSETTRAVSNYFEEILEEKFKERKEAQDVAQPDTGEMSVKEIVDQTPELEEELASPDFPEESFDVFEATELANEPMTEVGDLLRTEEDSAETPPQDDVAEPMSSPLDSDETPDIEEQIMDLETTSLVDEQMTDGDDLLAEARELEEESPELLPQDDTTVAMSSPLDLDEMPEMPDIEEQVMDLEATSLVDEPMADGDGFSLVDEPPTAALPALDVIEEPAQSEAAVEVSPGSVISASGFKDASEEELPAVKTARRLARIIVSDIVIYNEKKVEEGLQTGQFFELLSEEIDEGRQLYHSRVDKDGLERDYLQEALSDYVNKKTSLSSTP